MKKLLLFFVVLFFAAGSKAQTTYYWVGGAPLAPQNISLLSNWNTALDGSGTARTSSTAADILVFDGRNYGGATPTTGVDSVNLNASISCAQLKFVNGARIVFNRGSSGTSTLTIVGDGTPDEDFLIESGCSFSLSNGPGSQVINLGGANNSGRVSGDFKMITGLQARIANGSFAATTLVFTSGASFTTNITSSSAAYPFGNSSQSTEKWVTFESGATLFYEGGYSPNGSSSTFQPIQFMPGSLFVLRASNPVGSGGSFFNRKAFANVQVLNGATLTADGPINQIDTLTVQAGATFYTHSSGQTVVLGDVLVHGELLAPAGSTNELLFAGRVPQTLAGTGTISPASLLVADGARVVLQKNTTIAKAAVVSGELDFGSRQLTGGGTFMATAGITPVTATGKLTAGAYLITGINGLAAIDRGVTVSGAGLLPGTRVTGFTAAFDSAYISTPALSTASTVSLTFSRSAATLICGNPAGFDPALGAVTLTDEQTFEDGINYVITAPTAAPFGISTGAAPVVKVNQVQLDAAVTTNAVVQVFGSLQVSAGRVTIRPADTVWLQPGANLPGTYGSQTYFVTSVDPNGRTGVLRRDAVSGVTLFPVGTENHYLPVTLNPVSAASVAVDVFEGITQDGLPTGTPLTAVQKQTAVDAVWNVNRLAGSGDARLTLQWTPLLEGTTFATFADSEIGIIKNTGDSWSLPYGTGDNTHNTADTVFQTFGQFSVGARPPADPFVFNPLPDKVYGDPDFSPGVISSNTTVPVTYSSSNPAVASIVNGNLHITGTGTTIIRATQASDGFYPAADVSQVLTVNKAPLTIKADRKTKPEGDANPTLTASYTGFVRGETEAVLLTPVQLATTATAASDPGSYVITVCCATAANYTITFVNDSLVVRPRTAQTITFPAFAVKTYGAADFAIGASSTNSTLPITYTSSNPAVATIAGNNLHVVGAGTTTITASQAGNEFYFPAKSVSQMLTVNKAPLTIRIADTTKVFGQPNPAFRFIYSGFVLGETAAVLTTPPAVSAPAGTASAPGNYPLEPVGAVAANYSLTYVPGTLTIYPASGTGQSYLQAFASSSTSLTVRVYSPVPDLADVIIYDISGRPLLRRNVFLAEGFTNTVIGTFALSPGLYMVQVAGKTTNLKTRIVLIH